MADAEDLIDFSVIETQKENILSLPGGRSAKSLASICSPLAVNKSPTPSETQVIKNSVRQNFENELLTIAESDDPLDIYERYIKWTSDAYPTAQATAESNLLPLLERATKTFLTSSHYKNDPRYLKMWLLYIRLFSDSPRETYAFIARHNVGESLALFYEEFAAWLESQERFTQAAEVYLSGIDHEARPTERLIRKFGEFQHRMDTQGPQNDGPSSPALPKVRPALAAKVDPFAVPGAEEIDPQAGDRATAGVEPTKSRLKKLAIFADGNEQLHQASSDIGQAWDSIGNLGERRKENTREARPWAGETLNGGTRTATGPKLMIFKDRTLGTSFNEPINLKSIHGQQQTVNPKTGRRECVIVDLQDIYPDGDYRRGREFCLEEVRARRRGLLDHDWKKDRKPTLRRGETTNLVRPQRSSKMRTDQIVIENGNDAINKLVGQENGTSVPQTEESCIDDEESATQKQATGAKSAKKSRREDRANRTQKIQILEVRAEPQTIQTNLASPQGPKLRRKKSAESTMTFHTKEAMEDVYDLFNRTLTTIPDTKPEDAASQIESDDDYISAGDSTGTGCISGAASEYGDDTQAEISKSRAVRSVTDLPGDNTHDSRWSEFTAVQELPDAGFDDDELTRQDVEKLNTSISPAATFSPLLEEDVVPRPESAEESTLPCRIFPHRGQNRPPFMTPIVEKTESSLGAMSALGEKDYVSSKTPCRKKHVGKSPVIPEYDKDHSWSSPFHHVLERDDKENMDIPRSDLPKSSKAKLPLESSKSSALTAKDSPDAKDRRGPIIEDFQCNPIEDTIRHAVISHIQPPIESYHGYFDRRGHSFGRGGEIRKFCKAMKGKGERTVSSLSPPTLRFEGSSRRHRIKRELGKGAFAPVYLVDCLTEGVDGQSEEQLVKVSDGDGNVKRGEQEAIKMEDPPSPWEFYIIRQAKWRLGESRPSDSVVAAHEMHLFDDECYLVEEFRDQGTLLDSVNICRAEVSGGGTMDEQLVMFFSVELLRTVEALHSKGLIHGDLKADNVLVRLKNLPSDNSWSPQYRRDGMAGWSEKGITLIDFGRGIDMKAFRHDVQFIADWKTNETDCAEMREMRPWTYQVDYHGLAGIIHSLLFGKYLESVVEKSGTLGAGASKTYRIRENLKRYWQTEIWNEAFDVLLNPLAHSEGEKGMRLPVQNAMKGLRIKMETYLEQNSLVTPIPPVPPEPPALLTVLFPDVADAELVELVFVELADIELDAIDVIPVEAVDTVCLLPIPFGLADETATRNKRHSTENVPMNLKNESMMAESVDVLVSEKFWDFGMKLFQNNQKEENDRNQKLTSSPRLHL